MQPITLPLGARSYNIYVGAGALSEVSPHLQRAKLGPRLVIITNPNIFELHGFALKEALSKDGFEITVLTVPDGEEYKSLETAGKLYTDLSAALVERGTPVLALGGGVIGDLAGFVAATYMRGLPLVHLPTTLLAQVDSSIGGKTAINHGRLKNQIGAFYQPVAVFTDTATLKTLPQQQLPNGMAEVIKTAVVGDPALFDILERRMPDIIAGDERGLQIIVLHTATVKAHIVSRDEKDAGLRNTLNFGHTIGHAIESVSDFKVNHGTAVAAGMAAAGRIATKLGLFPQRELDRLLGVITSAGLPTSMPQLNTAEVLEAIKHDKKATEGRIRFILPTEVGKVIATERVTLEMVAQVLSE
jgi:3-dehydroquinate synthase